MRTITDLKGIPWEVSEIGRSGYGVRIPGEPIPEANMRIVTFNSKDGRKIVGTTGNIDNMTDEQLLELLDNLLNEETNSE